MNCLKCGTELKNSGVFCPDCLTDMDKYPVKPTVTVQLPHRPAPAPAKKKTRRPKYVKPEEQIRHLKDVRKNLAIALAVAIVLLAGCIALLIWLFFSGGLQELSRQFNLIS